VAPLEDAPQTVGAGRYRLAGDAAPRIAAQRRLPKTGPPQELPCFLPQEQEVHLTTTLRDLAAAFARCARACRSARPIAGPLMAAQAGGRRPGRDEVPSATGRAPDPGVLNPR
jgi:hypothetical protein